MSRLGILLVNQNQKDRVWEVLQQVNGWREASVFLLDNGCVEDERFGKELHGLHVPVMYRRTQDRKSVPTAYNLLLSMVLPSSVELVWVLPLGYSMKSLRKRKEFFANDDYAKTNKLVLWGLNKVGSHSPPLSLTGASMVEMLFASNKLVNLGGFQEQYYSGEYVWWDWLWRLQKQGVRIVFQDGSEGVSKATLRRMQWYFAGRNPFLFARLRSSNKWEMWWLSVVGVFRCLFLVPRLVGDMASTRQFVQGVRDGLGLVLTVD